MSHIDVMKQALEALENLIKKTSGQAIYSFMETERRIAMAACVGLREALTEQPAQEPDPDELTIAYLKGIDTGKKRKPWVGLTDEDFVELCDADFGTAALIRKVETMLKGKNA